MLEGPIALALLALERRRVVEAIERSDLAPDDAIEVRTDRARRALVEAVANLAESNIALALFGIGFGQRRKDLGAWGCQPAWFRGAFRRLRRLGRSGGDHLWQRRRVLGLAAQEDDD